jgi:dTDP-4-dehydrorhamnose reductase
MVFEGEHVSYSETDTPNPITDYARAKAIAEGLVLGRLEGQATVVRTSLITDSAPLDPLSVWVVKGLQADQPLTLFVDELRCPIWVEGLAAAVWELATGDHRITLIHIAGPKLSVAMPSAC